MSFAKQIAGMKRMPLEDDVLTCVNTCSGYERAGLNYLATILHGTGMELGSYSVRELKIQWKENYTGRVIYRDSEAVARPRPFSPASMIALASCVLSVCLLIWAALIRDGVAVVGIIIMSFTAPILCAGSRYDLQTSDPLPSEMGAGDVVFRTRDGAFTIIHCNEDISQLLYFARETPEHAMNLYTNRLSGGVVGGLMLIVGIALFGDCSSCTMQAALAVTYTLLNVVY